MHVHFLTMDVRSIGKSVLEMMQEERRRKYWPVLGGSGLGKCLNPPWSPRTTRKKAEEAKGNTITHDENDTIV